MSLAKQVELLTEEQLEVLQSSVIDAALLYQNGCDYRKFLRHEKNKYPVGTMYRIFELLQTSNEEEFELFLDEFIPEEVWSQI